MSETCKSWKAATVRVVEARMEWVDTPPHTHVSAELVNNPDMRAFIETVYEIGDRCSVLPFAEPTRHARLRPTVEPREKTTNGAE